MVVDVRSQPDSAGEAGPTTGRAAAHEMPRWVKIFGILAAVAFTVFATLHHGGGEMGLLAHDAMVSHALPGGHAQHLP